MFVVHADIIMTTDGSKDKGLLSPLGSAATPAAFSKQSGECSTESQQAETMKGTLKYVFQDFAENTTAHAPPKVRLESEKKINHP